MRRLCSRLILLLVSVLFLNPVTVSAAEQPVTARLLVSNPAPFVGEQIELTLEIRYRSHPGGRAVLTWPGFDQAITSDAGTARSNRYRADNGEIVETLQRSLRPLQTGMMTLDHARLSFGAKTIPVAGIRLNVRPLPLQEQPAGFSGLVGHYRLHLDAAGSGTREIVISVFDDQPLGARPEPLLQTGNGETLVLLGFEQRQADGLEREHRWHYLYLPKTDTDPGQLAINLPVFNPTTGLYQRLQADLSSPPTSGAGNDSLWPLLLLISLLILPLPALLVWRRRPLPVETCLQKLLGQSAAGLCRQTILDRLADRLDAKTRDALTRYWRQNDEARFMPTPAVVTTVKPPAELCHLLRKLIDKKPTIP